MRKICTEPTAFNVKAKIYDNGVQITTYSEPHFHDYNVEETGYVTEKKLTVRQAQYKALKYEKDSANRAKNRIYDLARANEDTWVYFVTITFNPKIVDSFDYDSCIQKVKSYLDNLRRTNTELHYLFVPERHKSGRFHFHGLIGRANLKLSDSGHKTSSGKIIYNIDNFNWGFTTATVIENKERTSSYLAKYVTKQISDHLKGKKRYLHSNNLKKPEITYHLQNLSNTNFEKDSIYHKEIIHHSPRGEEYINYYEYDKTSNPIDESKNIIKISKKGQ